MDVAYINPFLGAVAHVFSTMLKVEPARRPARMAANGSGDEESLTGVISISGQVQGVVALRFPPSTALNAAARFLRKAPEQVATKVTGTVSELVNMVGGFAKGKFEYDPPLSLGLPMVVKGRDYNLEIPEKTQRIEIPMTSDLGDFSMEISIREVTPQ